MTDPNEPGLELGPPTDVSVDADEVKRQAAEEAETPTDSATRYGEGDAKGGTGGLDAGGAG